MKLNEEITSLLGAENLAEGTAEKLAELVENYVASQLEEQKTAHDATIATLEEAHVLDVQATRDELTDQAKSYAGYVTESVTEKINEYVDAAVSKYVTENEDRFARLDTYDRMQNAFDVIKEAFESNGFEVKEDAVSSKLQEDVSSATAAYNHLYEQSQSLRAELVGAHMELAFTKATANLTDTQKEKVQTLAESVQFEGVEEFGKALELIVSQAITKNTEAQVTLNEEVEEVQVVPSKVVSDRMQKYIDRLG